MVEGREKRKRNNENNGRRVRVEGKKRKETTEETVGTTVDCAASWLITKCNLSEHRGNTLSNIVSPQ